MIYSNLQKNTQTNRGYTLLFAVLVSSLVLAIGISILNISKKEFLIATSARDSSEAFYASDGALECALLANYNGAFSVPVDPSILNTSCTNGEINFTSLANSPFVFHIKPGDGPCATVTVTKTSVPIGSDTIIRTDIDARGYNTGWNNSDDTCTVNSAKRVERNLRYSY
jgi:hypothetical protein